MKGLCFIPPLHRATLKGIKVQTRRIVKPPKIVANAMPESLWNEDKSIGCVFFSNGVDVRTAKPRFNLGEIVYMKEPYVDDCLQGEIKYAYDWEDIEFLKANGFEEDMKIPGFWKNKLFMPESVAKSFIQITETPRIEQLQDISNKDCIKEGIYKHISHARVYWKNGYDSLMYDQPRHAYEALINLINGKKTWASNPFVHVYDYKLVDKPKQ